MADEATPPKPYLSSVDRRRLSGKSLFHEQTIRRWEIDDPLVRPTTRVAIDAAALSLGLALPRSRTRPRKEPS